MKVILLFIIVVHGLIHLLGFVKEWNLAPVTQLSGTTSISLKKSTAHTIGVFWLAVSLLFLAAAAVYVFKKEWWWILVSAAVVVSQILIAIYWKDGKWGTVANAILLVAAITGYANWHFNKSVNKEVNQLFAAAPTNQHSVITPGMLNGLPAPVQIWLKNAGVIGKEKIHTVRLKQKGWMRTKPKQNKWVEATAEQYITIDNPAFVWKVNMNLIPFLPLTGRDKFIDGKGQMTMRLLSLIPVVNSADHKIDQGALQRYLSEISWYPSAALSPYIQWEAIDAASAKATMTYKDVSGSVVFHFNERGDMVGCSADRYMGGGREAVLEKWAVDAKEYALMNDIKMPVTFDVTWKLKTGDFTWYKLEVTEVEYNTPLLYNE